MKYVAQIKLRIEVGAADKDAADCVIAEWAEDVGAFDVQLLEMITVDYEQD